MDARISFKPGSLLVVFVTGMTGIYIAEVVEETPLCLKMMEKGPWAKLKHEDFVIKNDLSLKIQSKDDSESTQVLREAQEHGHPLISKRVSGVQKSCFVLPSERRKQASYFRSCMFGG